jgi:hypothetical protein
MAITADLLLGFVEKKIYKKIYGSPGGLIQWKESLVYC